MPPKKIKKSGSKKKDSKRKDEGEKLSELDKEIFQIQIRDLGEKLNRLKTKNQELETTCQSYKREMKEVTEDKKEIVAYLRTTLDQRADEIAEMQERLNGLQKAKEDERVTFEQQLQELKTKHQLMKDQLTSENIVLGGKLASLEEFQAQKEETFAKLETLKKQLKQQEIEHHQALRNIEKQNIMAKDQLKKEMNQNLHQIAADFRRISNQQMPDTTRRAIQENAVLTNQIQTIKTKLESAVEGNRKMTEIIENQKIKIKTLEGIEKDWISRNQSLVKTNELLNEKVVHHESIIEDLENTKTKFYLLDGQLTQLTEDVAKWKSEAIEKSEKLQHSENTISTLSSQLESTNRLNQQIGKLLSRLTRSLKSGLNIDQAVPPSLNSQRQKEEILSDILDLLNNTDMSGKELESSKEQTLSVDCYFSGDIGLVPRPKLPNIKKQSKRSYAHKSIQTDGIFYMASANTRLAAQKAVKSAAYRLLQEVNCSPNLLSLQPTVNVLMRF